MAIVKETKIVFFKGNSIELIKGNEVQDSSDLVRSKPELFEITKVEVKKPVKKAKVVKTEKVEKVEDLVEEVLIEAPVAALEVEEIEETKETEVEKVEVKQTTKRKRK